MSTFIQVVSFLDARFELSCLEKATALLISAWMALYLARRSRASVRHFILLAAFAGLAVLPLFLVVMPKIPFRVQVQPPPVGRANNATTPVELRAADQVALGPHSDTHRISSSQLPMAMMDWVWIAGTAVFLMPVALGVWRLRRLGVDGMPWPDQRVPVQAIAAGMGVDGKVKLRAHEDVTAPLTYGFARHTIVLPPEAGQWQETDLRRSLVHELEHIRRRDWTTQVIVRMICAIYWFHPLAWIARRRLCLEAERACDDAAILGTTEVERTEYAAQLVSLARRMSVRPAEAILGFAQRSDLSRRISALLDNQQSRGRADVAVVLGIGMSAAFLLFTLAPIQLIAQLSIPHEARMGLPVYPGAKAKPEQRDERPHRGSLSLDHLEVSEAWAGKYQVESRPSMVQEFYREWLSRFGVVTECTGGRNTSVSIRVDLELLEHPAACSPMEFGQGEIELKAGMHGEFWIVTIQPIETGSEFTLVHIRDAKPASPRAD
jgi:beta-lactamase regulating signal transducer with metallopeptidase domain